jgi:hypothetical protein
LISSLFCYQVPVAALVFVGKALQLYVRHAARWKEGGRDKMALIPANPVKDNIKWSLPMLCVCAMIGLLAGTVGGLLGLGGGFILAPVYLELGVPPEVIYITQTLTMEVLYKTNKRLKQQKQPLTICKCLAGVSIQQCSNWQRNCNSLLYIFVITSDWQRNCKFCHALLFVHVGYRISAAPPVPSPIWYIPKPQNIEMLFLINSPNKRFRNIRCQIMNLFGNIVSHIWVTIHCKSA